MEIFIVLIFRQVYI